MSELHGDHRALGCAVALSALPAMTPARLRHLVERWGPQEAWARVVAGAPGVPTAQRARKGSDRQPLAASWQRAAANSDPELWLERCRHLGVGAALIGERRYPAALAGDHQAPVVLFWLGNLTALDGCRATIVGTRQASAVGLDTAYELGHQLAGAGVRVVSGLALGIDGAAHRGALAAAAAPPVAVVGSGLDVIYPRQHRRLWSEVAAAGVVLSEWPPGSRPEAWRFPWRNRMLAALGELVVVVESRRGGGSLSTVDAADARGRTVMAVPGSVRSPASEGTNQLLVDGRPPVRDATDVLIGLGLTSTPAPLPYPTERAEPPAEDRPLLALLASDPRTIDDLQARTGRSVVDVAVALGRLEAMGWVRRAGPYYRLQEPGAPHREGR